jgi:hypothetical protein
LLELAPSDTLIILNCCWAGNAVLSSTLSTTEILAAADRDTEAFALEHSFLKVLVKVLTQLGTARFSIDELHAELDKYNTPAHNKVINAPFHRRLPNRSYPSIRLQPLPTATTPSRSSTDTVQDGQSASKASFFVEISPRSPEKASEAGWDSFFMGVDPSLVRRLHFYTAKTLPERLKT